MSPEETTPLLTTAPDESNTTATPHDALYARFSTGRKRIILAMVSMCGAIPLFVAGSFMPVIPNIAKDLGTTGAKVSLAVSISVLAVSVGTIVAHQQNRILGYRLP